MELDQLGRMDIAVDLPPAHDQGVNANRALDGRFFTDDQDSLAEHLALEDAVDPRSAFEKKLPFVAGSDTEKCVDDGFVVLHRGVEGRKPRGAGQSSACGACHASQ